MFCIPLNLYKFTAFNSQFHSATYWMVPWWRPAAGPDCIRTIFVVMLPFFIHFLTILSKTWISRILGSDIFLLSPILNNKLFVFFIPPPLRIYWARLPLYKYYLSA